MGPQSCPAAWMIISCRRPQMPSRRRRTMPWLSSRRDFWQCCKSSRRHSSTCSLRPPIRLANDLGGGIQTSPVQRSDVRVAQVAAAHQTDGGTQQRPIEWWQPQRKLPCCRFEARRIWRTSWRPTAAWGPGLLSASPDQRPSFLLTGQKRRLAPADLKHRALLLKSREGVGMPATPARPRRSVAIPVEMAKLRNVATPP